MKVASRASAAHGHCLGSGNVPKGPQISGLLDQSNERWAVVDKRVIPQALEMFVF